MFQRFVILIVAMFFLLGCSLTTQAARTPSTPLPTQTALPTQTPLATAQLAATATPAPTATTMVNTVNTPIPVANRPCATRTDWPVYYVVSGDTLADIAQRSASTVNDLATANCLANANNIFVGQQLRVPRIPATATPYPVPTSMDNTPRILSFIVASEIAPRHFEWTTWNAGWTELSVSGPRGAYIGYGKQPANGTFTMPDLGMDFAPYATFTLRIKDFAGRDVIGPDGLPVAAQINVEVGREPLGCPAVTDGGNGDILVSPVIGVVGRCTYVADQRTLWISWEGIGGIQSAEFYFLPTAGSACGTPGNPNVIGTDRDPSDGVSITWYIGDGPCAGLLYAFAYGDIGSFESRQQALVVYSK